MAKGALPFIADAPAGGAEGPLRSVELPGEEARRLGYVTGVVGRGRLHAFDMDPEAIKVGKALMAEDPRFVIHHAPFADRLEEAVRKDPALADLTNAKGQRAIDLACLECRSAMQKALFFLGRYDVDKGPPEHRSATSLVVRAVDHAAADDYGKLFDEVEDGDGTLDVTEIAAAAAIPGLTK